MKRRRQRRTKTPIASERLYWVQFKCAGSSGTWGAFCVWNVSDRLCTRTGAPRRTRISGVFSGDPCACSASRNGRKRAVHFLLWKSGNYSLKKRHRLIISSATAGRHSTFRLHTRRLLRHKTTNTTNVLKRPGRANFFKFLAQKYKSCHYV
jgi:hypothetical protein